MCAADESAAIHAPASVGRVTSRTDRILARTLNAPGWIGTVSRVALLGLLAVGAAAIHIPRPETLCPLRALTGIPCPLCGSTSAAVALGDGDPVAALAANPVTVLVGAAWLAGPMGTARWWWSLVGSRRLAYTAVLFVVAWAWQLARLGWT